MASEDAVTPPNPYASPKTDSQPATDARPEPKPFGLTEPIHAAGNYSFDDVRQALWMKRGFVKTSHMLGLYGLMTLWYMSKYRTWGPADLSSLTMGTIVAVGLAFVVAVCLSDMITKARLDKYLVEDNRHREMIFSEETVTIRSAISDMVGAWTMFSKCTCSQSMVLLHVFPHTEWCFVPRSFFTTQEDWDLFVRLVRHKLPEETPLPLPASNRLPESVEDETDQTPTIRGQGVVQLSEIRRAMRYTPENWLRYALPAGAMTVALLPTVYAMIAAGPLSPVHFVPGILGVAVVIWRFSVQPRWQLAAMVQKCSEHHTPTVWTIAEEELRIDTHYARTRYRWDCFEHFQNLGDLVLLYFRQKGRMQMVPASFFTGSDWQRLLQMVARKLPEK